MKGFWQKNNRIRFLFAMAACLLLGAWATDAYAYFVNERREQTILQPEDVLVEWEFLSDLAMINIVESEEETVSEEIEEVQEEEVSEETEEVQEEAVSEEAEEETEASETEQETEPCLSVLSDLTENQVVILEMDFPEGYDSVEIGLNGGDFPEAVCYSTDGINGYELSTDGKILLDKEEASFLILLIYFPNVENMETYTLDAAFSDTEGNLYEESIEGILSDREVWTITLDNTEPVIRGTGNLKWNINSSLTSIVCTGVCEQLTIDGYNEVDSFEYEQSDNNGITVFKLSNTKDESAQAGTYQLVITQTYVPEEGTEVQLQKVVIPFFVNYR